MKYKQSKKQNQRITQTSCSQCLKASSHRLCPQYHLTNSIFM